VAKSPFQLSREHVLLPFAAPIGEAGATMRPLLSGGALETIVSQVPDVWLFEDPLDRSPDEVRAAYRAVLTTRLDHASLFEEEAERARAVRV